MADTPTLRFLIPGQHRGLLSIKVIDTDVAQRNHGALIVAPLLFAFCSMAAIIFLFHHWDHWWVIAAVFCALLAFVGMVIYCFHDLRLPVPDQDVLDRSLERAIDQVLVNLAREHADNFEALADGSSIPIAIARIEPDRVRLLFPASRHAHIVGLKHAGGGKKRHVDTPWLDPLHFCPQGRWMRAVIKAWGDRRHVLISLTRRQGYRTLSWKTRRLSAHERMELLAAIRAMPTSGLSSPHA